MAASADKGILDQFSTLRISNAYERRHLQVVR